MSPAPGRRPPSILESFNVAFEGIIHVLRTQRNMRIHFLIAVAVLIAALAVDVSKIELIVLLLSIAFVLIAEMINTAIEAAVDIASTSFDPMAKLPQIVADEWRWPLVHGILHLLGLEHGDEMERRERVILEAAG